MPYHTPGTSGSVSPVGGSAAADKTVTLAGFSGIDRRLLPGAEPSASKPSAAAEIENFRVLSGGTLEKRCGFRCLATLYAPVRAAVSANFDGEESLFCAAGDGLYLIDPDEGAERLFTLRSAVGNAFFYRDGKGLCLFAGGQVVRVRPTEAEDITYVPLYVNNCPASTSPRSSRPYEPCNLLIDRVRLTYVMDRSISYVYLPFTPKQIVGVYLNGVLQSGNYAVENLMNSDLLRFTRTLEIDDELLILATVPNSLRGGEEPLAYAHAAYAIPTGEAGGMGRICLAAPDRGLYQNESVDEGEWGSLYFPARGFTDPSEDGFPILGFLRHFHRLLCFSATSTYKADLTAEEVSFGLCNSGTGSVSAGAATMIGNAPVTVSDGRVFRFTDDTEDSRLDEATCISDALGEMSFPDGACLFFDRSRRELWLRDPGDDEGRVHICDIRTGNWFDFTGIGADGFFSYGGEVGYFDGGSLYLSDPYKRADDRPDGTVAMIPAAVETHWLGFGAGNAVRRSGTFAAVVSAGGGTLSWEVQTEAGAMARGTLTGQPNAPLDAPEQLERGFSAGRFRFLKLRLSAAGIERVSVYGLTAAGRR